MARAFLTYADQDPTSVAYWLALFGGLRLGEVLGLRWDDVDFEKRTVRIEQVFKVHRGEIVPRPRQPVAPSR